VSIEILHVSVEEAIHRFPIFVADLLLSDRGSLSGEVRYLLVDLFEKGFPRFRVDWALVLIVGEGARRKRVPPRALCRLGDRRSDLARELLDESNTNSYVSLGTCMYEPNSDQSACEQAFKSEQAELVSVGRWNIAIFVLAPIPIAWLIAFMLVALVRWIRRGFKPT